MLRILQISDTHLFADTKQELLGVNTEESFKAILKALEQEQDVNCVIHTGDLSQDHSKEAYLRLAASLRSLNVPIYHVPGNHDDHVLINGTYPCYNMKNDKHILMGNWQIILLDSHLPKKVEGAFHQSQLFFLRKCLNDNPNPYTLIFFHHHPISIPSLWLDRLGLINKREFWDIVENYSQIKAVFFGHIHQEIHHVMNSIPCYSVPSTCIQFKPNQDQFALHHIPPGYRWIQLSSDGHLETGIKRLKEYIGHFNEEAKGY